MTFEDKIRLLRDIGVWPDTAEGKILLDNWPNNVCEDEKVAKLKLATNLTISTARMEEEKKHKYVYWLCHKSPPQLQVKTLVFHGITRLRCGACAAWMRWSYKPFTEAKT